MDTLRYGTFNFFVKYQIDQNYLPENIKISKIPSKMKPEVVSREIVKPSSSIPKNHPKFHNLSFFDQIVPSYYVPLLYFYTCKNEEPDHNLRSRVLKTSLSAALSHYYPLAGRINYDMVSVDCNDEGALFLEATIGCGLSEILISPDDVILKLLFPDGLCYKDSTQTGPVAVQVTYFQCGGMSVGICLCHKMMEMASMSSFISDWASLARNSDKEIDPEFNIGSLYPPLDLPILKQKQASPPVTKDCVSRRVVFDGLKIAKLKELVAERVPNPTRVEVVASLLYKSAICGNAKASSTGSLIPSFINCAMNLRSRVSPPISEREKGNISGIFRVSVRDEREVELGCLVTEFRKAKTRLSNSCANITSTEDLSQLILKTMKPLSEYFNAEHEVYGCTSWCRYPFYGTDFGWGKPLWVTTVLYKLKNGMTFIDTKDGGGIEAFICLEDKAVTIFENDQDLLLFCSVNPSI